MLGFGRNRKTDAAPEPAPPAPITEDEKWAVWEELQRELEDTLRRHTLGGIIEAEGFRAQTRLAWLQAHPNDRPGWWKDTASPENRAKVDDAQRAEDEAREAWEAAGRRWMAAQAVEKALDSSDPRYQRGAYQANLNTGALVKGHDDERLRARAATVEARVELDELDAVYGRALAKNTDMRSWAATWTITAGPNAENRAELERLLAKVREQQELEDRVGALEQRFGLVPTGSLEDRLNAIAAAAA